MTIQEIQTEKLNLIRWIANLEDLGIINQIKSIQKDSGEIFQWHKDLIDKRLQKIEDGDEKFYDFDKVIKEIENEL